MTKKEREENPGESFDGGYHIYAKEKHAERVAKNPDRVQYAIEQFERNNVEYTLKNAQIYKNSEGYNDPTVGEAMNNIEAEERRVLERISALIPVMKKTAELVGFEVVGRIVLVDKETGKKYK